MKFKIYNQKNCKSMAPMHESTVRFAKRSGLITFSKSAAKLIGLSGSDKIEFIQNENKSEEWYIRKAKLTDPYAFSLRGKNSICAGVSMNCSMLVNLFVTKKFCKSVSYAIGESIEIEGCSCYPINLTNPINEKIIGEK